LFTEVNPPVSLNGRFKRFHSSLPFPISRIMRFIIRRAPQVVTILTHTPERGNPSAGVVLVRASGAYLKTANTDLPDTADMRFVITGAHPFMQRRGLPFAVTIPNKKTAS